MLPEPPTHRSSAWVDYDPALRRVWVGGQRLHHGATGAAVAAAGIAGLIVHRLSLPNALTATLLGTALMAHDWHDRSHWFEPGPQPDRLPLLMARDRPGVLPGGQGRQDPTGERGEYSGGAHGDAARQSFTKLNAG